MVVHLKRMTGRSWNGGRPPRTENPAGLHLRRCPSKYQMAQQQVATPENNQPSPPLSTGTYRNCGGSLATCGPSVPFPGQNMCQMPGTKPYRARLSFRQTRQNSRSTRRAAVKTLDVTDGSSSDEEYVYALSTKTDLRATETGLAGGRTQRSQRRNVTVLRSEVEDLRVQLRTLISSWVPWRIKRIWATTCLRQKLALQAWNQAPQPGYGDGRWAVREPAAEGATQVQETGAHAARVPPELSRHTARNNQRSSCNPASWKNHWRKTTLHRTHRRRSSNTRPSSDQGFPCKRTMQKPGQRHVQQPTIQIVDTALVKPPKTNKLSTRFVTELRRVTHLRGSMVMAARSNGHTITSDSSFIKKLEGDAVNPDQPLQQHLYLPDFTGQANRQGNNQDCQ